MLTIMLSFSDSSFRKVTNRKTWKILDLLKESDKWCCDLCLHNVSFSRDISEQVLFGGIHKMSWWSQFNESASFVSHKKHTGANCCRFKVEWPARYGSRGWKTLFTLDIVLSKCKKPKPKPWLDKCVSKRVVTLIPQNLFVDKQMTSASAAVSLTPFQKQCISLKEC